MPSINKYKLKYAMFAFSPMVLCNCEQTRGVCGVRVHQYNSECDQFKRHIYKYISTCVFSHQRN